MESNGANEVFSTWQARKWLPSAILASPEHEMKVGGYRAEASDGFSLPPALKGIPQHLIGFVLSSFPNGLPSSPSEASALVAAAMEEAKAPTLAGLSSELRQFVFAAFPNGLPPSPTDGTGLVDEASKLHAWPRSEELSKTECQFIDAKLVSGYVPGQGGEQLNKACAVSQLQAEMSFFESKKNDELRAKIGALGGDPDPQAMEKFGIKALLGFVALGLVAANPLLAVGMMAKAAVTAKEDKPEAKPGFFSI